MIIASCYIYCHNPSITIVAFGHPPYDVEEKERIDSEWYEYIRVLELQTQADLDKAAFIWVWWSRIDDGSLLLHGWETPSSSKRLPIVHRKYL